MECCERIKSFIRIRPLNINEKSRLVVKTDGNYELNVLNENDAIRKSYSFEYIFEEMSTQSQIYDRVVSPLVDDVISGFNSTIFAYGQTCSGKTYTMEGIDVTNLHQNIQSGIIPRAFVGLYEKVKDLDAFMQLSYMQIYNEDIFDLLSEKDAKLSLYKDAISGTVVVKGMRQVRVESLSQMHQLLQLGVRNRQNAVTLSNAQSSRSHSVCTVTVNVFNTEKGQRMVKMSKLNMVDLAGSENIRRSGSVDARAREAGKINQSLLTLGRVIKALTEKSKHIPYRESKLTRILEDSLGGRTRTSIIANISPSLSSLEETISTLDYAIMAESIENKPQTNRVYRKIQMLEVYVKEVILQMYDQQIDELKDQLIKTKTSSGFFVSEEHYKLVNT